MASGSSGNSAPPRPRRRRITQACDYCHRRSVRCRPSGDGATCQNCSDFAQPCTYQRKPRRRGVAPHRGQSGDGGGDASNGAGALDDAGTAGIRGQGPSTLSPALPRSEFSRRSRAHDGALSDSMEGISKAHSHLTSSHSTEWYSPYVASQATIVDLVELYFEIVYPVFPLFHQPSFVRSISRAEYTRAKPLFAATMAVCALVSSRIRDGAVTNPRWDVPALRGKSDPDMFYAEAKRQLATTLADQRKGSDLNVLRAHAILAIAAIQNGNIRDIHQHMGSYHTLMAMDGLHDESNWPRSITVVEREERRRLFWSIYTLDIYSAVVWGSIIRSREQQSNVAYPMEVDDEFITDAGISLQNVSLDNAISPSSLLYRQQADSSSQPACWLSGWNFITDLYRVLEHALVRFHGHRRSRSTPNNQRDSSFLHNIFGDKSTASQSSVQEKVLQLYINLPPCFKETPEMMYDIRRDRFGFQAANITGSLQLVRMVLFAAGGASIGERCRVASEVVSAFMSIPAPYLLAISTPQLHHLGGIGGILGSVFEEPEPLAEADYRDLRDIMLSMAQLLESLEANHRGASASEKLRSHTARIDEYMVRQRQAATATPVPVRHNHVDGPSRVGFFISDNALQQEQRVGAPQGQENAVFDGAGQVVAEDWSLQMSPNFLGEFTWNFDFG